MSKLIYLIVAVMLFTLPLRSQDLPAGAVELERARISPTRGLILWMPSPTKNPRTDDDDIYTCPDQTRGHYYSGISRVTLYDPRSQRIINTIDIEVQNGPGEEKRIDLPYKIKRGYYTVPVLDEKKEGKPVLMSLKDYNNDGLRHEFALFDAVACMGLETTLIGYSKKQDKVIQYPIEIKTPEKTYYGMWADYLFGHKPNKKGVWQYKIDYRGRGGTLDKYTFRYDRTKEKFFGTLFSVGEE